jgi:HSP20 family protein
MPIIRWDPYRDMLTLRDRMNRLFEEAYEGRGEEKDMLKSEWYPSVDIYEKDKELVLMAELPGMDEKDIDIEVEGNTLTLKGKREIEKETKEDEYHRIERSYGSFYRSFNLPYNVDAGRIKAEHSGGLLRITMPKKPELKPKKVKILKSAKAKSKPKTKTKKK